MTTCPLAVDQRQLSTHLGLPLGYRATLLTFCRLATVLFEVSRIISFVANVASYLMWLKYWHSPADERWSLWLLTRRSVMVGLVSVTATKMSSLLSSPIQSTRCPLVSWSNFCFFFFPFAVDVPFAFEFPCLFLFLSFDGTCPFLVFTSLCLGSVADAPWFSQALLLCHFVAKTPTAIVRPARNSLLLKTKSFVLLPSTFVFSFSYLIGTNHRCYKPRGSLASLLNSSMASQYSSIT